MKLGVGLTATQYVAVRGVLIVFLFSVFSSRYWDANVSHINAVSHSAPGVSGHVCEHTPTLRAQCTHSGLVLACSVSDSSEIIAPNSTNV